MNIDTEAIKRKYAIETVLQEIRNIVPEVQEFINIPIEEFTEKEYKKLEMLMKICEEFDLKLGGLEHEKLLKSNKIKRVEEKQSEVPLVPIEEIEPNFKMLKERVYEITAFLESEEKKEFLKAYKELKNVRAKVDLEKKKEEDKVTTKELKEKVENLKKLIMEPDEPKGVAIIGEYPKEDYYCNNLSYPVKYNKVVEGYTSEKFAKLPIFPKCVKNFCIEVEAHVHDDERSPMVTREFHSKASFKSYEECSLEEKQGCKEVEKRIEEIKSSEESKYDRPGTISFCVKHKDMREDVKIDCTERQLANAGILPEDVYWKKERKISPKAIADASKALTIKEVGGVKSFFTKLLDKLKGKGEK